MRWEPGKDSMLWEAWDLPDHLPPPQHLTSRKPPAVAEPDGSRPQADTSRTPTQWGQHASPRPSPPLPQPEAAGGQGEALLSGTRVGPRFLSAAFSQPGVLCTSGPRQRLHLGWRNSLRMTSLPVQTQQLLPHAWPWHHVSTIGPRIAPPSPFPLGPPCFLTTDRSPPKKSLPPPPRPTHCSLQPQPRPFEL